MTLQAPPRCCLIPVRVVFWRKRASDDDGDGEAMDDGSNDGGGDHGNDGGGKVLIPVMVTFLLSGGGG